MAENDVQYTHAGPPPAATLIENFVVTATENLILVSLVGVAPSLDGLVQVPAFSMAISVDHARALARALASAVGAVATLTAAPTRAQ